MRQKQKAFTLIELLVVIAIIGLLASIVLIGLNTARAQSRDAKRAADANQISAALELYYSDNGHYPITICSGNPYPWASFDSPAYSPDQFCSTENGATDGKNMTQELSAYMGPTKDPLSLGGDSGYLYIGDTGNEYCILIWRTPENLNDFPKTLVDFARCTGGIDGNGQCINSSNSIYIGNGNWSGGC
jgi:prepilin-type N-terminal cleavage/methylation domain-containing protein